jgi:hypothetical protein
MCGTRSLLFPQQQLTFSSTTNEQHYIILAILRSFATKSEKGHYFQQKKNIFIFIFYSPPLDGIGFLVHELITVSNGEWRWFMIIFNSLLHLCNEWMTKYEIKPNCCPPVNYFVLDCCLIRNVYSSSWMSLISQGIRSLKTTIYANVGLCTPMNFFRPLIP